MTTPPRQHPLLCQCGTCKTPFAMIRDKQLVIMGVHHGQKHVNVITLERLKQMIEDAESRQ